MSLPCASKEETTTVSNLYGNNQILDSLKIKNNIDGTVDGFVWLGDEKEPLLLQSTIKLIHILWDIQPNDTEVDLPLVMKLPSIPVTKSANDSENDNEDNDNENNDNENNDDENDTDTDNIKNSSDSNITVEDSTTVYTTRSRSLADKIQSALSHIRFYRHQVEDASGGKSKRSRRRNKGGERVGREENRIRALEHQQGRLLIQQKQQQQENEKLQKDLDQQQKEENSKHSSAESDDEENDDHEDDIENGEDGEEEGDEEEADAPKKDDDDNNNNEPPMARIVRTINSIRILTTFLLPILLHEERNNKELTIAGENLPKALFGKRKKKESCWLFGPKVFDISTVSYCNSLLNQVQDILEFCIPYKHIRMELIKNKGSDEQFWRKTWLDCIYLKGLSSPPVPPLQMLANLSQTAVSEKHIEKPFAVTTPPQTLSPSAETPPSADAVQSKIVDVTRRCDDQIMKQTEEEKKTNKHKKDLYQKAIKKLHKRLSHLTSQVFKTARLSVYGSCLSQLTLQGSDVDLSLHIPEAVHAKGNFVSGQWTAEKYEKEMRNIIFDVFRCLCRRPKTEFCDLVPVVRARVPVIKGKYRLAGNPYTSDGSINFDICFLNDIAVANSQLIREYSLFDERIPTLMILIKQWAKMKHVSSAPDNSISSYAWLNMVIFYLQCIGFVPNLQDEELWEKIGLKYDSDSYWHTVNNLKTCFVTCSDAEKQKQQQKQKQQSLHWKERETVTSLLYGFFHFYGYYFPSTVCTISIKQGKITLPKTMFKRCSLFYCIEDPFETFDSYCPHNLGSPANEIKSISIIGLIRYAEEELREYLLQECSTPQQQQNAQDEGQQKKQEQEQEQEQEQPQEQPQGETEAKKHEEKVAASPNSVDNPKLVPTRPAWLSLDLEEKETSQQQPHAAGAVEQHSQQQQQEQQQNKKDENFRKGRNNNRNNYNNNTQRNKNQMKHGMANDKVNHHQNNNVHSKAAKNEPNENFRTDMNRNQTGKNQSNAPKNQRPKKIYGSYEKFLKGGGDHSRPQKNKGATKSEVEVNNNANNHRQQNQKAHYPNQRNYDQQARNKSNKNKQHAKVSNNKGGGDNNKNAVVEKGEPSKQQKSNNHNSVNEKNKSDVVEKKEPTKQQMPNNQNGVNETKKSSNKKTVPKRAKRLNHPQPKNGQSEK